jgi:hypothetical protein
METPSPGAYAVHTNPALNSFILPQTDHSSKPKEIKNDSVFKSTQQRDFLNCVSIEAKLSPGPGSYITLDVAPKKESNVKQ